MDVPIQEVKIAQQFLEELKDNFIFVFLLIYRIISKSMKFYVKISNTNIPLDFSAIFK